MNPSPLRQRTFTIKTLLAGAAALALAIQIAPANITFDLRASGTDGGTISEGKLITLAGTPGTVTLQVWAQLTNAAPTSNVFGVQSILGSIVSASSSPALLAGAMSPALPAIPFNNQSIGGQVAELTLPADGILDLGSNDTNPGGNTFIRFRKDPSAGGTQVGTVFFASNLDSAGATFNQITNGFEFLMGTATLTIDSFVNPSGTASLNWKIPTFPSPLFRAQIANWTDGDGAINTGNQQFAEMSVGSPVSFLLSGGNASTWIAPGGGSWAVSANWDNGVPLATANFGSAITAPATVTLDGDKTINILNLASANAYTIAPGTGGTLAVNSAINVLAGSHTIAAPVNLAGSGVTATVSNASDTLTISGAISGTSRLTKNGAGRLLLTGVNTFANTFVVNAGIVDLNASGGNALADFTEINGGTLRLLRSNQISDNTSVIVQGGTFDLGANSETVGLLQLFSGSITSAGGTLTSLGEYFVESGAISANLAGSAVLNKEKPGTVTLTGTNTFTGLTTVIDGVLNLNTTGATAIAGNVLIQAGTLRLLQSNQIADLSIVTIESGEFAIGNQSETVASVVLAGGSITGTGGTLTSTNTYDVRSGSISANLAGSVGLTKTTQGNVSLTGTNTYSGPTTLIQGSLEIGSATALPSGSAVTVAAGAQLDFNATANPSVGSLNGAGSVVLSPGSVLSLGANGGNVTFSGSISGDRLIKVGPGRQSLNGTTSFTGAITVNAGLLSLSGSLSAGSFIAQNGGRLSFDGGTTVNLGFGSIRAEAGSQVDYGNATINGGFLRGPGTHIITTPGTSIFTGVTSFNSTVIHQNAPASFVNFTNGGGIMTEAELNWDGGVNVSSGRLIVDSVVRVRDWTNDGVVTVLSEGVLIGAVSDLVSGGGSRITIEAGGRLILDAERSLDLQGSLLVNNGEIFGATEIYFGALAKGNGAFGPVSVFEGGSFSPGNSPGAATINGRYTWGPGGSFDFEIADARGTAGSVTGWDLVNVIGPDGFLDITAGTTTNSRFTLRMASNDIDQALPALNFDSSSFYQWLIVDTSQGVTGFDPSEVALDTSRFVNPLNGGSFALATDGDKLFLNFNPVPEPSCAALLLAGAGLLGLRRRA